MRHDYFYTLAGQVLFAVLIGLIAWAAFAFERETTSVLIRIPRCRRCRYNLVGLGPGPRCPECGENDADQWRRKSVRLRYSPRKAGSLALFLPPLAVLPWVYPGVWWVLYRLAGYRRDLADRFSRLADPVEVLDSHGPTLAAAIAMTAALACIPTRRMTASAVLFAAVLLVAAGADIAWQWWGAQWVQPAAPHVLVFIVPVASAVAWGGLWRRARTEAARVSDRSPQQGA